MKPTKAARDAAGQNKVELNLDPTEDERVGSQGTDAVKQPVQQLSRPASVTPQVVTEAAEARAAPRSAAEEARGMRAPSTQGARSGPMRGGGGGSSFKVNRGLKGAMPVDPYSSLSLNVYVKGGMVKPNKVWK